MARKNNLIELTLEVKRKGTDQIGKYKKELSELKKTANDLNLTLNKTQKELSKNIKDTSVNKLGKDSKESRAQIEKLEKSLKEVTDQLKKQKKAQDDLKKSGSSKISNLKKDATTQKKILNDRISSLKKQKKEQDETNKGTKQSTTFLKRLGNATATVNGPLNEYSGRINSLATGFKLMNPLVLVAITSISALAFALPGATRAFAEMERQLGRIDALLKQTGGSAGFTVGQFETMSQEIAMNTLTSLTEARDAIGIILSNPNIRTENFERLLTLSQDVAEVTGSNMNSSAKQLSKALADPIKGISKLTQVGVVFTEEQEKMIKSAQAMNGTFAAQKVILDVLESQYGGAAQGAAQGLAGTLDTIGQRLENTQLKLGELANKTGVLDYIGDLAFSFENLVDQIYQAESAIDVMNAIIIAMKNGSEGQNELVSQTLKANSALKKAKKDAEIQKAPIDKPVREAIQGSEDLIFIIEDDIEKYGEVQEKTLKEIDKFQNILKKKTEQQISKNNALISGSVASTLELKTKSLVETGRLTEEQFKKISELGVFDKKIIKGLIDAVPFQSNENKTLAKQIYGFMKSSLTSSSDEETLSKIKQSFNEELTSEKIEEMFNESSVIAAKSTEELRKIYQIDYNIIAESKKKENDEIIKQEEAKNKKIEEINIKSGSKKLEISLRAKEEEIRQELIVERRKIRKDSDNIDIKNRIVELEAERDLQKLNIQNNNLVIKQLETMKKLSEIRSDYGVKLDENGNKKEGSPTDDQLKLSSPEFLEESTNLEETVLQLENVNNQLKFIDENSKKEIKFNIEVNQDKIQKQLETIIEDTSIKQKELTSRLQGNTEESLENQLKIIDEKYDKKLKNIEERVGKIPENIANEISDEKSFEKANKTFDNINKRFKDLNDEFKNGKVSLESYIFSFNELNKVLKETGDGVGVDIKQEDLTKGIENKLKGRTDFIKNEIEGILLKIEDADFSKGIELRKESFDELKEYTNELFKLKEINPEIDLTESIKQIKEIEKKIQETYTLTEKVFKKLADDMASTFANGITDMATKGGTSLKNVLKQSIAEAFGNYAADRLKDMVFNGFRAGLEQLGSTSIGSFLTELNFGDYFSSEDDNAINYDRLEGTFVKSMELNNKKEQNVKITNPEDISPKKADTSDKGKDDLMDIGKDLLKGVAAGPVSKLIGNAEADAGVSSTKKPSSPMSSSERSQLTNTVDKIKDMMPDLGNLKDVDIKPPTQPSGPVGGDTGNPFTDTLPEEGGFFATIKGYFTSFIDYIKNLIPGFDSIISGFKGLFGGLGGLEGLIGKVTGSLGGLGNLFTSLMSGLSVLSGMSGSFLSGITGGIFHEGGMVGEGGQQTTISPQLLKGAKYFHEGGHTGSKLKSDEMAAILKKDEYVMNEKTTSDILKRGSVGVSSAGSAVNITNTFGSDDIAIGLSGNKISEDNIVNTIKSRANEINQFLNRR